MSKKIAAAALTAGLALAAASPAGATIVVGKGMAGIELGMFDTEALEILGDPTTSDTVRDRNGGLEIRRYFKGPKVKYVVTLPDPDDEDRTVTTIVTRSGVEKTPEGVGVGTAERNLRAKVAGVRCASTRFAGRTIRQCSTTPLTSSDGGVDQTTFTVSAKTRQITKIQISRFYD